MNVGEMEKWMVLQVSRGVSVGKVAQEDKVERVGFAVAVDMAVWVVKNLEGGAGGNCWDAQLVGVIDGVHIRPIIYLIRP